MRSRSCRRSHLPCAHHAYAEEYTLRQAVADVLRFWYLAAAPVARMRGGPTVVRRPRPAALRRISSCENRWDYYRSSDFLVCLPLRMLKLHRLQPPLKDR
jgi:hypothetical protein